MTQKQLELLNYLKQFQETRGYCPSYEEMMRAMGLSSKSGIYRLIKALLERGHIKQTKAMVRGIEIVKFEQPAQPSLPTVTVLISADGYYLGVDPHCEFEVKLQRV